MSSGTKRYQKYSVFEINPRRPPIIASPNVFPLEFLNVENEYIPGPILDESSHITEEIKKYFKAKNIELEPMEIDLSLLKDDDKDTKEEDNPLMSNKFKDLS